MGARRRRGAAGLEVGFHRRLAAARRIYLSRGFRLVAEEPHRSFGVDLVGQTYELGLLSSAACPDPCSAEVPAS